MTFVYLDHAATSFPKPNRVVRAVERCLRHVAGSPGRGGHAGTLEANRLVHTARERAAALLGVGDPARIVLTSGATEGINVGLHAAVAPGDHLIVTDMEHNAVARPVAALERAGVAVSRVRHDADPARWREALDAARTPATCAVVAIHASNVCGQAIDLEATGAWCAEHGITLGVDAAQSAGLLDIRVDAWGIGWLAASGHKSLLGPQGVGVLAVGPDFPVAPLLRGGTGSGSDSDAQPDWLPDMLESGTRNTPGIAGLSEGLAAVLESGPAELLAHGRALVRALAAGLDAIDGVEAWMPVPDNGTPVISFRIRDVDPSDTARALEDGWGVRARVGLHCAPDAHRRLGTFPAGTVRLSPGSTNTQADVDRTLEAIAAIAARGRAA